jgi:nicotinamide-nucleotide amidase
MKKKEINFSNPEKTLGTLLTDKGLTIATAESCTAGGIGNRISSVSGASNYLVGGVITYATEAKEKLLGVKHSTIEEHNVVSANVALEMATGVMKLFDTDVSIGITGLAGPDAVDGIEPGTIYIAVALKTDKELKLPNVVKIVNCNFNSDNRDKNIANAIYNAVLLTAIEVDNNFPTV